MFGFGESGVPSVTVEELKARYDAKQTFILVDVREPDEHSRCRLPSSKLIPLGQLADRFGELRPSEEIIVHCRSGARSAKAVRFLREKGFSKTFNLEGGILAWAQRIDPSMPAA